MHKAWLTAFCLAIDALFCVLLFFQAAMFFPPRAKKLLFTDAPFAEAKAVTGGMAFSPPACLQSPAAVRVCEKRNI